MQYDLIETGTDRNDQFVEHSVTVLTRLISEAIQKQDHCILGLSGGSTPRDIYSALGKTSEIDWSKVWLFLADERYVPADDERSNAHLVRSTLLASAKIPKEQIVFPNTALPYDECVQQYSDDIEDLLHRDVPDVIVLGMGPDGHIASLFPPLPDEALLGVVIGTTTDAFDVRERISVTLPVLTSAKHSVFLLKGEKKKLVWDEMLASSEDSLYWPAKEVLSVFQSTVIGMW